MTATELHTLVLPLIGSACEPKDLECQVFPGGPEWYHKHQEKASGRGEAWSIPLPVSAAAAMWEVAIMDALFAGDNPRNKTVEIRKYGEGRNEYEVDDTNSFGLGPTRLHALVAAAVKVMGVKG